MAHFPRPLGQPSVRCRLARWDQSRAQSRFFQRRCQPHSCRCRAHCHGQCRCRRRCRRVLVCLHRRETWQANLRRHCWAVRLSSRAAPKSPRQSSRRCPRCRAVLVLRRRLVLRRGPCLCAPVRIHWVPSLLPEKVAGERYYWRAGCRRALPRHHRCSRCRHLPRTAKAAEERRSARPAWVPRMLPESVCRFRPRPP